MCTIQLLGSEAGGLDLSRSYGRQMSMSMSMSMPPNRPADPGKASIKADFETSHRIIRTDVEKIPCLRRKHET